MTNDPARLATANEALRHVQAGMTIGLGSGRAVFALTQMLGTQFGKGGNLRAAVASSETAKLAEAANIEIVNLAAGVRLDIAFDGADEIDPKLRMIKGRGAALLREKLVMAAAEEVIILAEAKKLSDFLGTHYSLPVEIIPFAWAQTQQRVSEILDNPALRADTKGKAVTTDNGNFLLDGTIPEGAHLEEIALRLSTTLGVVDHGLFLDQADQIILGKPDGSSIKLTRTLGQ